MAVIQHCKYGGRCRRVAESQHNTDRGIIKATLKPICKEKRQIAAAASGDKLQPIDVSRKKLCSLKEHKCKSRCYCCGNKQGIYSSKKG